MPKKPGPLPFPTPVPVPFPMPPVFRSVGNGVTDRFNPRAALLLAIPSGLTPLFDIFRKGDVGDPAMNCVGSKSPDDDPPASGEEIRFFGNVSRGISNGADVTGTGSFHAVSSITAGVIADRGTIMRAAIPSSRPWAPNDVPHADHSVNRTPLTQARMRGTMPISMFYRSPHRDGFVPHHARSDAVSHELFRTSVAIFKSTLTAVFFIGYDTRTTEGCCAMTAATLEPMPRTETSAGSLPTDARIVFFDGVCGFCNASINFLLKRDTHRRLLFAPLQGETARERLSAADIENLNSMVFCTPTGCYRKTAAVVRIGWTLGGVWSVLATLLWLIPRPLRDVGYNFIARNRYRIFGKKETCRLPTPDERARFLN